jgi:cell division septation protein DedD
LSYQLYEFLTSLESVDAFAVLVIDEAQHLAQPLLDEIRALADLEAGRRLLQIVLVGQPELQTRLKQFHMRQIDQRVTTRCELRPLIKQEVAGYVAHRLATVGGAKERIAFASAAIDVIHAASNGVPRLVNIICDRALSRAHLARLAVIEQSVVAGAIDEMQLTSSQVVSSGQVIDRTSVTSVNEVTAVTPVTEVTPVAPMTVSPVIEAVPEQPPAAVAAPLPPQASETAGANRAGLFDRRRAPAPSDTPSELHALLNLPTTTPRHDWDEAAEQPRTGASAAPAWKWRVDSDVRRASRFAWLKTAGLAVVGMGVVLIAGGIAVTSPRLRGAAAVEAPASRVTAPSVAQASMAAPAATPVESVRDHANQDTRVESAPQTPAAPSAPADTWVVQVAAFSSHDRSQAMMERLTDAGFPAFEVPTESSRGLLYYVRVGPFQTASEADEARARLRAHTALENAFVRSVTSVP